METVTMDRDLFSSGTQSSGVFMAPYRGSPSFPPTKSNDLLGGWVGGGRQEGGERIVGHDKLIRSLNRGVRVHFGEVPIARSLLICMQMQGRVLREVAGCGPLKGSNAVFTRIVYPFLNSLDYRFCPDELSILCNLRKPFSLTTSSKTFEP
ncbi:hypothetical protein BgiMline_000472 [Biomphalaria glabrata]